jgi:hypothetical protein
MDGWVYLCRFGIGFASVKKEGTIETNCPFNFNSRGTTRSNIPRSDVDITGFAGSDSFSWNKDSPDFHSEQWTYRESVG